MTFKKGESGNPRGRPKGTGQVGKLRAQILSALPGIVDKMILAAQAGDARAQRMLVERGIPVVKPELAIIDSGVPDGDLTGRAHAFMAKAMNGELPASTAIEMIGALAVVARIDEVDQLRRRIDLLENPIT